MTNQLPQDAVNTETGALVLTPDSMNSIAKFADFMAQGKVMLPDHLRGKPSDCMAVAIQAMQWGMNPFAVAQKTHLVSGTLGYEATLVNAVISSSTAIDGRFHYRYSEAAWSSDRDPLAWIQVGAILKGESEIQWGEKLFPATVATKNSPLWKTNPKQQAGYLALKYWARLYCPAVMLGVYTVDEVQEFAPEREINPSKPASALRRPELLESAEATKEEAEPEPVVDLIPVDALLESMDSCPTMELLDTVREDAEKYAVGTDERETLVKFYLAKKAEILRAEDAAKLAHTANKK